MAVEKWNPIGDLIALQDRMNNLLKEALSAASVANDRSANAWSPPMDFFETEEAFHVVAELPGLKRNDIDIRIEDHQLIVTARNPAPAKPNKDAKPSVYRRERSFGDCARTFALPSAVRTDAIQAEFRHGVLEVSLPKAARSSARPVKVDIRG